MASRSGVRKLLTSGGPGGTVIRRLAAALLGVLSALALLRRRGDVRGRQRSGGDGEEDAHQGVEAELERSSRYFELSRDLICTAGFDGYFRQLNAAWTEKLGWTEEELRARPFVEFVHHEDRARTQEESAALMEGAVSVDFVHRFATKDGGRRWIEWSSMAVLEEELV